MIRFELAGVLVTLLALGACGGDDGPIDASADDGGARVDGGAPGEDAGRASDAATADDAATDAGLLDAGSVEDDTHSCLEPADGPLVELSGDQGYTKYRNTTAASGTRFDAREARWSFQTFPTVEQAYPVDIRNSSGVCWAGGAIVGTNPLDVGWGETYAVSNGAALLTGIDDTPDFVLDGIRMHNVWDGFRPRSAGFVVKDVWMSYVRDDCIENDHANPGLVEDVLFDGCYVAFSARFAPAATPTEPSSAEWTIRDSLIRLEPMPGPHRGDVYLDPGHGVFFKWTAIDDPDTPSPRLRLIGNVFMAEQRANAPDTQMSVPASTIECRDNVMVWLGEGTYPGDLGDCFTVTRDRSVWDDARAAWIARHTRLADVSTD